MDLFRGQHNLHSFEHVGYGLSKANGHLKGLFPAQLPPKLRDLNAINLVWIKNVRVNIGFDFLCFKRKV
jgi:hypothetical protein